ncbi:MAG: hypothetical protein BWX86_02383 [Verrucomicrobia bacterium ADurb.Bin122]|nr:MAG: hypothetical protein BWX86_02383 [Verrucomicrobia bacterium ADurb.Bin122]
MQRGPLLRRAAVVAVAAGAESDDPVRVVADPTDLAGQHHRHADQHPLAAYLLHLVARAAQAPHGVEYSVGRGRQALTQGPRVGRVTPHQL